MDPFKMSELEHGKYHRANPKFAYLSAFEHFGINCFISLAGGKEFYSKFYL